ncbi:hypothetical protein ANCDUO_17098 [Ancylostoma duodenale]|uniref:Peptidase M13 N-terminal domain-containing protein n=1 Tax=Ancylostoma duodenale TaxID=51022 RepID=A0A0C2G1I1_9BILA|nr:hypothetical protein ANCDUO_17098 [Ancylostoma duodenale]
MATVLTVVSMELAEGFWETEELIYQATAEIADLEVQIAKASWPEREMRRHIEQYNPYTLRSLEETYPYIGWRSYLKSYLSLENLNGDTLGKNNRDFVNKPEKNAAPSLDSNNSPRSIIHSHTRTKSDPRRIEGLNDESIQCMNILTDYLPFGAGYVYVKSLKNRDKLYDDVKNYTNLMVQSFQDIIKHQHWMTPQTREIALERADKIQKNLGWPRELFGNFEDFTTIDAYHRDDYYTILDAYNRNKENFYRIMMILKTGLRNREEIRKLSEKPNRLNKSWDPAQLSFYEKDAHTLSRH